MMKLRLSALLIVLTALLLTACSQIREVAQKAMHEASAVATAPAIEGENMEIRLRVNGAAHSSHLILPIIKR